MPAVDVAHSSSGPGHRPLKAEIRGSNPLCATNLLFKVSITLLLLTFLSLNKSLCLASFLPKVFDLCGIIMWDKTHILNTAKERVDVDGKKG